MPANKLITKVSNRIGEMKKNEGLQIPPHYSTGNALNSAYLQLIEPDYHGQSMFDKCTPSSISQALLNMVIQGLTPAKNQCYFIAYGNKLAMQPSYFGNVTALKRLEQIKSVTAQVVHKDDDFETGSDDDFNLIVTKFNPKFENQDKPIIGAFAVITRVDGTKDYTIMTMNEIQQSWNQTRQKNNKVQANFGQEMAKRTVLNRASKFYVNTSDDSDLLAQAINQTTADEYDYDNTKDVTPEEQEKPKTVESLLGNKDKSHSKQAKSASKKQQDETDQSENTKQTNPIKRNDKPKAQVEDYGDFKIIDNEHSLDGDEQQEIRDVTDSIIAEKSSSANDDQVSTSAPSTATQNEGSNTDGTQESLFENIDDTHRK